MSGGRALLIAAGDIKLSHSVFAMPFALLGAFLAASPSQAALSAGVRIDWSRFGGQLGLVVVCMVLARTWAMLINRLADRGFDAQNPRTKGRAVASGRLGVGAAWGMAIGCAGLFIVAAGMFWLLYANAWPLVLALPVLGWLALYSYAKRFTALCHVLLGTALAISPIAAAIAVDPGALTRVWTLYLIALMVTCWVAGFDVIYALQDEGFDRGAGLFSIPAKLGKQGAVWVSRGLHVCAAGALAGAWLVDARFGAIFLGAVILACACLIMEHVVLVRRGLAGLPMAFFTLNGVLSCVVGGLGIADLLW